jgi:hypothetical protein
MAGSKRPGVSWQVVSATELVEGLAAQGSLEGVLPNVAAIYAWRLRLSTDTSPEDVVGFLAHIRRISQLPQGRIGRIPLSRSISMDGLLIGGAGLTAEKLRYLENFLADPKRARWVAAFLVSLEARIPALYVGKALDLPDRIVDHLQCRTSFGLDVDDDDILEWSDLNLEYVVLGPARSVSTKTLETFEQLFTVLSIASFTKRAG